MSAERWRSISSVVLSGHVVTRGMPPALWAVAAAVISLEVEGVAFLVWVPLAACGFSWQGGGWRRGRGEVGLGAMTGNASPLDQQVIVGGCCQAKWWFTRGWVVAHSGAHCCSPRCYGGVWPQEIGDLSFASQKKRAHAQSRPMQSGPAPGLQTMCCDCHSNLLCSPSTGGALRDTRENMAAELSIHTATASQPLSAAHRAVCTARANSAACFMIVEPFPPHRPRSKQHCAFGVGEGPQ